MAQEADVMTRPNRTNQQLVDPEVIITWDSPTLFPEAANYEPVTSTADGCEGLWNASSSVEDFPQWIISDTLSIAEQLAESAVSVESQVSGAPQGTPAEIRTLDKLERPSNIEIRRMRAVEANFDPIDRADFVVLGAMLEFSYGETANRIRRVLSNLKVDSSGRVVPRNAFVQAEPLYKISVSSLAAEIIEEQLAGSLPEELMVRPKVIQFVEDAQFEKIIGVGFSFDIIPNPAYSRSNGWYDAEFDPKIWVFSGDVPPLLRLADQVIRVITETVIDVNLKRGDWQQSRERALDWLTGTRSAGHSKLLQIVEKLLGSDYHTIRKGLDPIPSNP